MNAIRALLVVVGVAIGIYGAFLLNHWQRPAQLVQVGEWAALAVILHDGVLAPLAVGLGWLTRHLLSGRVAAGAAVAFALITTTAVSAFAVINRSHGGGKNHTLLDRNYPMGLLLASLAIAACVAGGYGLSAVIDTRRRLRHGASTGR